MAFITYIDVPLLSDEDMQVYGWTVERLHNRLPVCYKLSTGQPGTPVGEAEVFLRPSGYLAANLYIDDYHSTWSMRDKKAVCFVEKKIIKMILLADEGENYSFPIKSYLGTIPDCQCGAKYTTTPQIHLHFCPLYKK